jgi:hypothetical protein
MTDRISNPVVSLSNHGWHARPSFDRLRTNSTFVARAIGDLATLLLLAVLVAAVALP